jgi:hypothetical protein
LYWLGRLLGDFRAVETGRVGRRIEQRLVGRMMGRFLWKLFR